jgi:hypothetical protein
MIEAFNEAANRFDQAYESGNELELADALENMTTVSLWGASVPYGKVFRAVKTMGAQAGFLKKKPFKKEAKAVKKQIKQTLRPARLSTSLIDWNDDSIAKIWIGAPKLDAVYKGSLDHMLMAQELLRSK